MDLGLTDKVVLVTAASSGLGKATALAFAREGANVIICGRNQDRLDSACSEISVATGTKVLSCVADVSLTADIDKLIGFVTDKYGTIHTLINNAGGPPPGFFWETSDEDWAAAFELTLLSTVRLTRAALPYMRQQKWGRVINITSMTVRQPLNELLLSNSLRLGVIGWAKTLSNQVAAEGISINNLCPGWTKTERVEQIIGVKASADGTTAEAEETTLAKTIPMGRLGKPEEFAAMAVFLGSERASYITGTSIVVDGGVTAGY